MAELFVELFSEEIPSKLQIDARQKIKQMFEERLHKKEIKFSSSKSFSTPKRLVFVIDGILEKIEQKKKILKGPKVGAPQVALDGFIKSNNLNKADIYKKNIEKGEFYFANTKPRVINLIDEFEFIIPEILQSYSWKKSMKWSVYDLSWGRPLKSIIALFNNKVINFNFFHLQSNNLTFADEINEKGKKKVNNFSSYLNILKSQNIILDQEERKTIIVRKFNNICNSRKLKNNFNEKLIEEVVNLVERPNVIIGKFNEIYLKVPQEILIITMQQHQKYFPLFDNNNKLTNLFLLVSICQITKAISKLEIKELLKQGCLMLNFFGIKTKRKIWLSK